MTNHDISQIRASVSAFARARLLGHEREFDAVHKDFPLPVYQSFFDIGLGNWWIARAHGGQQLPMTTGVEIVEELAYGDAGVAFALFLSVLTTMQVELFGTPAQQERFLRPLAERGGFAATLGSEERAGSELTNIEVLAQVKGANLVINGQKFISTNSAFANFSSVITKCPADASGYAAVLVPKGTPGVKVVQQWPVIGVRGSAQYQISLEACEVARENQLPGHGLRVLESALNFSRVLVAASMIGIARRIRDESLRYAKQKKLGGASLRENAVFRAKVAQMDADIDCIRACVLTAARDLDEIMREPNPSQYFARRGTVKSSLVAKLKAGQVGGAIAAVGSEMFGGLGYTEACLVEKLVRDSRYVAIVEGGEDVTRALLYARYLAPLD